MKKRCCSSSRIMIKWVPLTFQNLSIEGSFFIDWLHDYILIFLILVVIFVGGILVSLSRRGWISLGFYERPLLEFIWTVVPGFILVLIGVPSLSILYGFEQVDQPDFSIKITGHQWYWSYDYSDFEGVDFDSYLKPIGDLLKGEPRLLETDNHLVLPLGSSVRLVISSSDVLHSWAIPPLGIKADANPGRINTLYLKDLRVCGLFYGQCSEICGANHSFMPICLEVCPFVNFRAWIRAFL